MGILQTRHFVAFDINDFMSIRLFTDGHITDLIKGISPADLFYSTMY